MRAKFSLRDVKSICRKDGGSSSGGRSPLLLPNDKLTSTPLTATSRPINAEVLEPIAAEKDAEAVMYPARVDDGNTFLLAVLALAVFAFVFTLLENRFGRLVGPEVATTWSDERGERLSPGTLQICGAHETGDELRLSLGTGESAVGKDRTLIHPGTYFGKRGASMRKPCSPTTRKESEE
jgi:hypothetical protein